MRACVAPPDFEAPADTAEAARDPELARARVPPGRVVSYSRRRWGLERAKFLRLREIWQDLLCCESDEYFRLSRALVPAEPIRRAASALAATAAARWPRRRLTWLHLRLEADWASDGKAAAALAAAHDLVAGQNGREHECAIQRGREDEVGERAEPLVCEALRDGADEEASRRGEVAG